MRTNTLSLLLLSAVLVLGMGACRRDGDKVHDDGVPLLTTPLAIDGVSPDSVDTTTLARSIAAPVVHPNVAALPRNPFPDVPRRRDGLDFETDPFGPTSHAEQRWLDDHGFPNVGQWETYLTASDALLEQVAGSGDPVARTILDMRLLPVDPQARTRLFHAGAEGNLFALNSLAAYLAGSKDGDLQAAYSISRVAEMRGDSRVAMARDVMMRRRLDDIERMQAEAEAIRMNHQLDRLYRQKHGANPPPPVRRPIAELEH